MRILVATLCTLLLVAVGCSTDPNGESNETDTQATSDASLADLTDAADSDAISIDSNTDDQVSDSESDPDGSSVADETDDPETTDVNVVEYRYVMLRDTSTGGVGPADGVDLFGLRLSAGDELHDADFIHYCHQGSAGNPDGTDCDVILGEPFGRCQDPETVDWVSLAGPGGIVVASFDSETTIALGDRVQTFVCGAGEGDRYDVLIGPDPEASSDSWWLICEGLSGSVSCAVPEN